MTRWSLSRELQLESVKPLLACWPHRRLVWYLQPGRSTSSTIWPANWNHSAHNVWPCKQTSLSHDDLKRLVEQAMERFGQIDVLVNNAGIECFYHFDQLTTEQIEQTLQTNLTGTILLTRLVVPHMLSQGKGSIINMASTAGKHCPPYGAVYGATKAGMIAFTQGLRGEYLDRGIRSTAICPGFTKSGGVYDRIVESTGRKTSTALGGTNTGAVALAVVKAIQTGPPEVIVNWPPVRPAMVIREIFPGLGEKISRGCFASICKAGCRCRCSTGSGVRCCWRLSAFGQSSGHSRNTEAIISDLALYRYLSLVSAVNLRQ